ncbi:MAG: hypothetical protein RID07_03275 [Lacipirellulaceae bacterium]
MEADRVTIAVVDQSAHDLADTYDCIQAACKRSAIDLVIWTEPTSATVDAIVAMDPVPLAAIAQGVVVLGRRTMNRAVRLMAAAESGVRTARWQCAVDVASSNHGDRSLCVLKNDWSFGRRGVSLVDFTDDWQSTVGNGDVLMERLAEDSRTFKLDLLCGSTVGSWGLNTRPLEDVAFRDPTGEPFLWHCPDTVKAAAERLSRMLIDRGVGYMSVDYMRTRGGYRAIELNTCSAGRMIPWSRWGADYVMGCYRGLQRLAQRLRTSSPVTVSVLTAVERASHEELSAAEPDEDRDP